MKTKLYSWIKNNMLGCVILLSTFICFLNVLLRYISSVFEVKLSSNFLIELQVLFFSLYIFLGLISIIHQDKELKVDLVSNKFKKVSVVSNYVNNIVISPLLLGTITYYSFFFFYRSYIILESSPDPGGVPRYILKFILFIGFSISLMVQIWKAIALIFKKKS